MKLSERLEKIKNVGTIPQLTKWGEKFKDKKAEVIKQLLDEGVDKKDLAEAMAYVKMKEKFPDFCPLYKRETVCHTMAEDELSCYGCDCPYFDVSTSPYVHGKRIFVGKCKANSKTLQFLPYRKPNIDVSFYILDCTKCIIPHKMKNAQQFIDDTDL